MFVLQKTAPQMFDFEIDGVQYSAVAITSVPADKIRDLNDILKAGDDLAAMFWIAENLLPPESHDAVMSLSASDLGALAKAYIYSSKADLGE